MSGFFKKKPTETAEERLAWQLSDTEKGRLKELVAAQTAYKKIGWDVNKTSPSGAETKAIDDLFTSVTSEDSMKNLIISTGKALKHNKDYGKDVANLFLKLYTEGLKDREYAIKGGQFKAGNLYRHIMKERLESCMPELPVKLAEAKNKQAAMRECIKIMAQRLLNANKFKKEFEKRPA